MTKPNPFENTWTEAEFAQAAGVHERTAKRWRDQRKGPPFIRVGRRVLYRRAAVEAWLISNEQEQPRANGGRR